MDPKLRKTCSDIFCGYDCLEKFEQLKGTNLDLTKSRFAHWMVEQHKELLEKMIGEALTSEDMGQLGDNLRKKMDYARKHGENLQPQPTPQDHKESGENKKNKGLTMDGKPRKRAPGAGRPPKSFHGLEQLKERSPLEPRCDVSDALSFATMAIAQLESIHQDDPRWREAFEEVTGWINKETKRREQNEQQKNQ